MLRHVRPTGVGQGDRHNIVHLTVPVFGKFQQPAVELGRIRILPALGVGGIAVSVDSFHDLPITDLHRAVPGLDDEAIVGQHIAEDDCLEG